jgi:nitric oxide reductase NorD protein
MNDRENLSDTAELQGQEHSHDLTEEAFRERLHSAGEKEDRQSILGLARTLASLRADVALACLETSASIAGVSLRVSIEFLRAAPEAAHVLNADEMRAWGEMGRRLAMSDAETAAALFDHGVKSLALLSNQSRALIFQICERQMTLSSSVAAETFRRAPLIAASVKDPAFLNSIFEVASDISRRSAKHSADFLDATPRVAEGLRVFGDDEIEVARAAVAMASAFATRAGGIAADAWSALPDAIKGLGAPHALKLIVRTSEFLERGGGAALHVLGAGGEALRVAPEAFDVWIELLWTVAGHGNAGLVAFVRVSPNFFRALAGEKNHQRAVELTKRAIEVTREVALVDAEAALACFRSSVRALRSVSIEQFEEWARAGLETERGADARTRRTYFAVETRRSNDALHSGGQGLALEVVQHTLKLYVEALTGRAVEVAPLAAVPDESRIGDGRTIHLPSVVAEFGDEYLDFRLYKVLAAHAAGQIEFGTHQREGNGLSAACRSIANLFDKENRNALDAFALDGYINDLNKSERALSPDEIDRQRTRSNSAMPEDADYRAVIALFPLTGLARRVFGTLENGRIDRRLRNVYRGLARDLDLVREHLRRNRPRIIDLPVTLVPFELLFQIALCGGALDDARHYYHQVVSELEGIVEDHLAGPDATVADTLMATARVYTLFQSITRDDAEQKVETGDEESQEGEEGSSKGESPEAESGAEQSNGPRQHDARELFSAWNSSDPQGEPDQLDGEETWIQAESSEQDLEPGEVAFNYDEWDRELSDHRLGWCRVIEKRVKRGDRSFVETTRENHKGVISSIRHQFQLMKPENLTRVLNELDGDDYNLNAVIDYVIDRRADGQQSERLYTKRLRRQRDVAVSFLLDQSSSTARTIGRHPLQPYTHPGRRIIEVEKEGLVLMSEALEAVGDIYSINGFTSEGRHNVKFYVVKDFDEKYSEEVERRIGGITYRNNTRLGAAIRHAAARLEKQEARTRLLIVMSDGRPYDHDYGDARYAREDTREALRQAKQKGITPFCITIDRESEAELRDLYGDIGYTIIDNVLSLPERMPGIYRRLTT